MVDVENLIFNQLYPTISPLCAKNSFRSVPTPDPTAFPTVAVFEMDNRTDYRMTSTKPGEEYAVLTYEAHVYATSRGDCRKVFKTLDDEMRKLNMTRLSRSFTPNMSNTQVHEIVARYRVEADQDGNLYRRN